MAYQAINTGTYPNDTTGDPLQTAFLKINANFAQFLGSNFLAGTYTFATLPAASLYPNYIAITTDQGPVYSNGSTWSVIGAGATNLALTANSISAAAANTTAIQTALTAQGVVNIAQAGTYYVNATLVIGSNTTLVLGPYTTIVLAPSSNVPLLMTASAVSFLNGGTTLSGGAAVTLTQGTDSAFNVLWTGHGQVAGNGVWLAGNTVSGYNGLFRIANIVDVNNFTIYTNRLLAAPGTGSRAVQATQNANVIGGTWDYSQANQTTTGYGQTALIFAGMIDSTVDSVNTINAIRAGYQAQACHACRFTNLKTEQAVADGFHFYGPISSCKLDGLFGAVPGGTILLEQTNVISTGSPYQFSAPGDIFDLTVNNVAGYSPASSAISIQPSDNEIMDAIHHEQISATSAGNFPAISVVRGSGFTTGQIGRMVFKNTQAPANAVGYSTFQIAACSFDQMIFEDCTAVPGGTTSAQANNWITLLSAASGNSIICNRIRSSGYPSTAGAVIFVYVNGAQVKNYTFNDCSALGGTGQFHYVGLENATNTVQQITFNGGFFDATISELVYCNTALASGTPTFTLNRVNLNGSTYAFRTSVAQNFHARFLGNTLAPVTAAVDTNSSNTIKISSDGTNDLNSGAWFANSAGTPVVTMYGDDITFDVGLLSLTPNQFCIHSSAVAGRNAANQQGPAFSSAGSGANHWYAQYLTTSII